MDKQYVTYSNYLYFNGVKLAFKKQLLFNIDSTPKLISRTDQGWWVNRKLLTVSKAKELIKNDPVSVDISYLQWYKQIELQECFNLI
jgi:hypothetical protein